MKPIAPHVKEIAATTWRICPAIAPMSSHNDINCRCIHTQKHLFLRTKIQNKPNNLIK